MEPRHKKNLSASPQAFNGFRLPLGFFMYLLAGMVFLFILTLSNPVLAQRLMDANRSTIGTIEECRVLNGYSSTIGYIEKGRILNSNRATLGYYEKGRVLNAYRATLGYVEKGRVLNANRATLGYYEGVIPEDAALFFFFGS